jgi:hypothetical protein
MAEEKIQISWDDVNSPEVDASINEQNARARSQQHYASQSNGPPSPHSATHSQSTSIWYNSFAYMALFGLLGGVVAWLPGEVAWAVRPSELDELRNYYQLYTYTKQQMDSQTISQSDGADIINTAFDELQKNPKLSAYFEMDDEHQARFIDAIKFKSFLNGIIWFAIVGIAISFCLSVADQIVTRNLQGAIINASVGVVLGLVGGVVVGLFVDKIYTIILGENHVGNLAPRAIFARAVGWAILGMFLSIGPGFAMRNAKRLAVGLLGGLIGGIIGGILFNLALAVVPTDVVSRLIGLASIGVVTGAATGLVENAAKTGWLRVVEGLIAGKQFVLYKNPTCIGSSPQCEIFLFKDSRVAPKHAAIHMTGNGFEIEDMHSGNGTLINGSAVARRRLRNNDQIQIGGTTMVFQEKDRD